MSITAYVIEDGFDWEVGFGVWSAGTGTLSRTFRRSSTGEPLSLSGSASVFISPNEDTLSDRITVTAFGAASGAADSLPAFQAAIARAQARGGGEVFVPYGSFRLSASLPLPFGVSLVGEGMTASVLEFTAPGDGIVVNDGFNLGQRIENLGLRSAHANCGRAIGVPTLTTGSVNVLIRNVLVNSTDPQVCRWDYGLFAENMQNSRIEGLHVYYAAKTGIHLAYACNANTFVGCEVVGLTADSEYGVYQNQTGSSGANLGFEDFWYGCTVQGHFQKAAWYARRSSPKLFGCHIENTNPAPSDGADIVLVGSIVNASFSGMEGGSLLTSGTIRNLNIMGGQMGDITIGPNAFVNIMGVRYGALVADATSVVSQLGGSTTSGALRASIIANAVIAQPAVNRVTNNASICAVPETGQLVFANTVPTSITNFSGGTEGQILVCRVEPNTTLLDGGNLRLSGDLVGAFNTTITLWLSEGVWFELCRSVN